MFRSALLQLAGPEEGPAYCIRIEELLGEGVLGNCGSDNGPFGGVRAENRSPMSSRTLFDKNPISDYPQQLTAEV